MTKEQLVAHLTTLRHLKGTVHKAPEKFSLKEAEAWSDGYSAALKDILESFPTKEYQSLTNENH
jgi:hypothetical protein